ncbi:uncharacterized protein PG986_003893 [Apiospora aurea]|uniref:Prion-inhibition and propagation HeLo domain-containing protein n=1 Tax=Apiospora aurea TaxID=335848 RepID=A0ABR1QL10_9PEZI
MEPAHPSTAFAKTARFFSLAVDSDKVPGDIQSCLDLVRTCHADVQKLIANRNERIDLLRLRPSDLAHINEVIESALRILQDVTAIVEASRSETGSGRTNLAKRFRWTYSDKERFAKHLPLIGQHHNAVRSELAYLRQMEGLRPSKNSAQESNSSFRRIGHKQKHQDVGHLVELLDGWSVAPSGTKPPLVATFPD